MKIADDWTIEDAVSGLKLRIVTGPKLNRLHIERLPEHISNNRDFFFDKEGKFDGTGSAICRGPHRKGKSEATST